jgi:hypothetical protein
VLGLVAAPGACGAPPDAGAHPPEPSVKAQEIKREKKAEKAKKLAKAEKKAATEGTLVICNHTGYVFDVYADGPSVREDDLAGSFDECTDWKPLLVGRYDIGFSMRTPSQQPVVIQARFSRDGVTYYKTFNNQGVVSAYVAPDQTTRIDLFIPGG